MVSTLITGALTLILGFIIGWLAAWIVVARRPSAPPSTLWRSVLLLAGIAAVLLLALTFSPLVGLSSLTHRGTAVRITALPTYTPYPTQTPYGTQTPYATYTPRPTPHGLSHLHPAAYLDSDAHSGISCPGNEHAS